MKRTIFSTFGAALFCSSLALTGCGGGGGGSSSSSTGSGLTYSGSTTPAAITSTNAQPIASIAGEAVLQASGSTNTPVATSISNTGNSSADVGSIVNNLTNSIRNNSMANMPAGFTGSGDCGGSISYPDAWNSSTATSAVGTITFTKYCDSGSSGTSFPTSGDFYNGSVYLDIPDINTISTSITVTFNNLTITSSTNGVITLNGTYACTTTGCTFKSNFTASDGSVNQIEGSKVTGDSTTNGYSGYFTLNQATYGTVTVTINSNVMISGACGTNPTGGSLSISSSTGSSATITFNADCTYTGTWNDGAGASGSFSGKY